MFGGVRVLRSAKLRSGKEQESRLPTAPIVVNVDGSRIIEADRDPGNWMTHGRTYSEQRFSPLDKINSTNVAGLGLAWNFELATNRGVETTPIVVDGTMYVTSSWSLVYALDAKTGALLWKYD